MVAMESDDQPAEADDAAGQRWVELPRRPRTSARHRGSYLMAAMLGLAKALGMDEEKEPTEVVQPALPGRDDDLLLSFNGLEPLGPDGEAMGPPSLN